MAAAMRTKAEEENQTSRSDVKLLQFPETQGPAIYLVNNIPYPAPFSKIHLPITHTKEQSNIMVAGQVLSHTAGCNLGSVTC